MKERISTIFKLIIESLKGEEKDYTSGSINKAIFLLAVPMILEMIMESLFALVDILFVAQVSVSAVATVGLTESVMMIIFSIAVGMSMATTAIVARRVGEKNYKKATDAAFQAILLAVMAGTVLGIAGFFGAENILRMMGGEEKMIEEGIGYTKIMYAGNLSVLLLFLMNAIFRGAGNPAIAMKSLWLANGLNIILDPILIFGLGPIPAMGVQGAAIATTIGRSIGVMYQVWHMLDGSSIIHLTKENIVIRAKTVFEMIKLSLGGIGQFLIESVSWIFLVRIMASFGEEAVAGYTLAFRIIVFTLLPSWGMSNAASTLVGQNLGAQQPERAETSVWRTAKYNAIFLVAISVIFFFFSEAILAQIGQPEAVSKIAISALEIICLGYIFFSYGMVIGQAFNGAGDTFTPMLISTIVFIVIQIPLAYWLAIGLDLKSEGVFISIAVCHSLYAITAMTIFRKGKWKLMKV